MPRLFNRPRNMPRFHQGRMFNRLTGRRAPRLYSGARPRRVSHGFFKTQVSPYGARGGGRRQFHAGHAGHAGNVYAAMLAQARSGQGTNMGALHHTPGYRGTRMAASFRKKQAKIRKSYRSERAKLRTKLRKADDYADANKIRRQLQKIKGQHRTDRRQAAADWSKKNRGASPRFGINVRQNPYSGRRFNTGFSFRRQQGSQQAHLERAQKRNMRIANRMNPGGELEKLGFDMRLHGGQGQLYMGTPATRADFTRGGRRRGVISVGDHWNRGRNAGRVLSRGGFDRGNHPVARINRMLGNRAMTPYEMSRMGSARGPHPQRTPITAANYSFDPRYHAG